MRLLERQPDDNLILREFTDKDVPAYAILSHTWLPNNNDEVSFQDVEAGSGKSKAGWKKITFCADKAAADGLRYFWIDTCCIKKSSDAELSESLNSMFRWYQGASKCYVYLADVRATKRKRGEGEEYRTWEEAFQNSRWFTRGWTLQELLAPSLIEFFSEDGKELGNKRRLEQHIHKITGIPVSALRGSPLSQVSIDEKFNWAKNRHTTREEDWVYSLLGIFGTSMPVIYGEGKEKAIRRLRKEIDDDIKAKECLRDLYVTDPRVDKTRIEETKGGLLEDSYHWILKNSDFQEWYGNLQSSLLWIKGDPGKGKTMLLCGIINELKKITNRPYLLTFFFCQATDSRINNATAVLRGLLYLLIDQQPSLISHVQKRYDHAGKGLFEDANAWVSISDIFINVLQDPNLENTYLIIDALDECITEGEKLLDFIAQKSLVYPHVKWLIASRNWPLIERRLDRTESKVRLCLELNSESVSAAVRSYIQYKVGQLKYDYNIRDVVLEYLSLNVNDTFLWVALVCQELRDTPKAMILKTLKLFPPGLDPFYGRMMKQISESRGSELCKQILASIATVYEPITLFELSSLVEMLKSASDDRESLEEIIGLCGSFLIIRNDIIYFMHQSAKDYIVERASLEIFPHGIRAIHYEIFSRSLEVMSKTLYRDIYGLYQPGYPIERVQRPDIDPLAASRYSCLYWIDHLCEWEALDYIGGKVDLQDGGQVDLFVREKYLYWLEALSLLKAISQGVLAIAKLKKLIQGNADTPALIQLIHDAYRFVMYHKQGIATSPLQVYMAGLIFSPAGSLIRRHFKREEPDWITIKPNLPNKWSSCLQTLEGHSREVNSVVFSHDSTLLASASDDLTVRIWNSNSGACQAILEGHTNSVRSVAFSHNSKLLASASHDNTIQIWDVSSSVCQATFKGHSEAVTSVVFSYNSKLLASASEDFTIRIWDVTSGTCRAILYGHSSWVSSVAFSDDSKRLASASLDHTLRIWNVSSDECVATAQGHSNVVQGVAFSHDSTRLASASFDHTVRIWDAESTEWPQSFEGHGNSINSITFSQNSNWLASASVDCTVRIWDANSCKLLQTFKGHNASVRSVTFSHDLTRLASASEDNTIIIWDINSGDYLQILKGHTESVLTVVFSYDSTRLASASLDETVRIWDASNGHSLQTFQGFRFNGFNIALNSVIFSHDSIWLAWPRDNAVWIWDASSGERVQTLEGHSDAISSVVFSPDSTRLASASNDFTVRIWDINNGGCLQILPVGTSIRKLAFDSIGSYLSTDIGKFAVDQSLASNIAPDEIPIQNPQYHGIGRSPDGEWITFNSENLIRLPSEYRPSVSDISGSTIGIGVESGMVWIFNLEVPIF
ncbi:MAG: hypothetical protein Q9160_006348 [Pyrenula sp. 1 TL-2023]